MKILLFLFLVLNLYSLDIIDKPINFDQQRLNLSQRYIFEHYGLEPKDITIEPRIIVIHWTAENDFNKSFNHFKNSILAYDRIEIRKASALNVSAHFLIAREGTIYRLMPENHMARHVIGLNYSTIAIENVGGEKNLDNLTPLQFQANIQLINYLKKKFQNIQYLIGHHEYKNCQDLSLWLEKDKNYKTLKHDPGAKFMKALRDELPNFKSCSKTIQ
ncbi:MAG: N-acetylmuramoyl-L-alanine amidase [Arcobacter sp.]|nr:MAG: N-acetylmuramoyl-L-alanine amidase [Arcobacter sp.]